MASSPADADSTRFSRSTRRRFAPVSWITRRAYFRRALFAIDARRRSRCQTRAVTIAADDALVNQFGLADRVVDEEALANSVRRFRERGITLPTFGQLADPSTIDRALTSGVDKDAPDPRNLFRVHWYNDLAGDRVDVPDHVVLTKELTGIDSPIIVAFGDRFPMITAHKVLAAYACLAPRVVSGQFDPTRHRAIWPSTGNYARGGIAISRIMASRGVAILPEGMSQERFDWLDQWCDNPAEDVIRTVGTESNVKEIYDACNALALDPANFVLNQFAEFGNHLAHYEITGRALGHVFEHVRRAGEAPPPPRRVRQRDRIRRHHRRRRPAEGGVRHEDRRGRGARVPDDARERLRRAQHPGHRRQAHPADPQRDEHRRRRRHQRPCDRRARRAVQHAGRPRLPRPQAWRRRATRRTRSSTSASRRSATCSPRSRPRSCSASVRTTRSSPSRPTVPRCTRASGRRRSRRRSAASSTTSTRARCSASTSPTSTTDSIIECTERDRSRIFNLGYYTWVEQQGTPFELFEARRSQDVLARPAPLPAGVGRHDPRVQRARRRELTSDTAGGPRRRLPLRDVWRTRSTSSAVFPWRCPNATDRSSARPADRVVARAAARRPRTRTRSSPSARTSRGTRSRAAHGMSAAACDALVARGRRADRCSRRHGFRRHRVPPTRRAVGGARVRAGGRRVGQGRDRATSAAATRRAT